MMRNLLFFLPLVFIAGCMVGPDFIPPCVPEQEEWMERDVVVATDERLCCWWQQLQDPLLNQLIALAEGSNLDLQAACFRIMEARSLLGLSIGQFFPQTQELYGSALKTRISLNAPNAIGIDHNFLDSMLGIKVAWELDFWGKYRRGIQAAGNSLLASYADYNDVQIILFADVATNYVLIRTLQERIAILLQNILIQKRSLEIALARYQEGVVTELDVEQAKTLLLGSESRLYGLQTEERRGKNSLATLLAIPPDQIDDLFCACWESKIPEPLEYVIQAGIPAELLYRRPDIRSALYQAAAQSARIGIAYSDFFPQISITGLIGLNNATDTLAVWGNQKFFSYDSLTYVFGPSFRWPIFTYGRITNRVRFEQMRFYELVAIYQNSVLVAYQEVEDALIGFVNTQKEIVKLRGSVAASERAVALAKAEYEQGIADYLRVLTSEEAMLVEQERLVGARGQVILHLIEAYRALGGGWCY